MSSACSTLCTGSFQGDCKLVCLHEQQQRFLVAAARYNSVSHSFGNERLKLAHTFRPNTLLIVRSSVQEPAGGVAAVKSQMDTPAVGEERMAADRLTAEMGDEEEDEEHDEMEIGVQNGGEDLLKKKKAATMAAEEEKVIKVEKKGGLLGQLQTLATWFSVWPQIPNKEDFVYVPREPSGSPITWEGWGTSLCWWANFVGGLPKGDSNYVLDLLFDPSKGLGLTIVRYNIGGGADLSFDTNLRPFGDIPGFKPRGPNAAYDWSADKQQRDVLFGARDRGANVFEAFSNSPPSWMTLSGSVTGNWRRGQDNLNPIYYEAFADYLTEVVLQYQKWGLHFDTLAPFNEPCEGWWYIDRNKPAQEGCNFSIRSMAKVILLVKQSLARKGLAVKISAFDAWSNNTLKALRGVGEEALAAVDQVNVHTYVHFVQREDDARRKQVERNVFVGGKKLWMSEYGPLNWGGEEYDIALAVGRHITLDLNDLRPSAWCYWQVLEGPGSFWGLLQTPLNYQVNPFAVDIKKQYYVMMQFTRWIRPGFKVFRNESLHDFLVTAVHPSGLTVVLVLTNTSSKNKDVSYDLTEVSPLLKGLPLNVTPFRTSMTENHVELPSLTFAAPLLVIRSIAKSITTLVISQLSD